MSQMNFNDLWPYPQRLLATAAFPAPSSVTVQEGALPVHLVRELRSLTPGGGEPAGHPVRARLDDRVERPEGYRLTVAPVGTELVGRDAAGLARGVQTLLQLLHLFKRSGTWTQLEIEDWPTFARRGFMVDMGRSVFPLPMLKRIVRILARLKLNQLHLHLYDDELCGLRFDGLPFGGENPYAITISDLAALVRYAAEFNVDVVPELESWGRAWANRSICGCGQTTRAARWTRISRTT